MLAYVVIRGSRSGLAPVQPLAVVCTDGRRTVVGGDGPVPDALRQVGWPTATDVEQVLLEGLAPPSPYLVTEGPISWDGDDPAEAAAVLAAAYELSA